MGQPLARLGDPTDHGGTIISGAARTLVDGKPAARVDDQHECGYWYHGTGTITKGSERTFIEGKAAARVGDTTSCGATIVSGSETTLVG
jgi:uncharacterized Zn-binding protein involved in type VI secretion